MTVGQPLQVVAQVQSGAAHDGNRAEAGIEGTLADDVRNALVAPEQRDLVNEVSEQLVEVRIGPGTSRAGSRSVTEDAAIGIDAVAHRIAQDFAAVELIQSERSGAAGEPDRAGAEQLLQFLD